MAKSEVRPLGGVEARVSVFEKGYKLGGTLTIKLATREAFDELMGALTHDGDAAQVLAQHGAVPE